MKLQGRNLSIDMQGDDVKLLHSELRQLGFGIPDEELSKALFGSGTRDAVLKFQSANGLEPTGEVEATTASAINAQVDTLQPRSSIVRGQVHRPDGAPVAGVRVRAYDKDLRSEEMLGEVSTNEDGQYEIAYTAEQFHRAEKGSADLFVVVFDADEQEHARSDIVFNARQEETVDLVVGTGEPELSEFDYLLKQIQPLLEGQGDNGGILPIDHLSDHDIAFLENDTGLARERIAWLVQAFRLALETAGSEAGGSSKETHMLPTLPGLVPQIPPQAFYGWIRGGLPDELGALLEWPTAELLAALEGAIQANHVPHDLREYLDEIEDTLDTLKAARALAPAPEGQPASLGDILNTLPEGEALSTDEQLTFARLREAHGDTDALWQQAEAAGLSRAVPSLKRTLRLDTLTVSHPSLMGELQIKADPERPESTDFLTTVEPEEWIELVFEHDVPPGSELDRDAYIDHLQLAVEREYAALMLRRQLEKKLDSDDRFPTRKVLDFLSANPDLDVRTTPIEPVLVEQNIEDEELRSALLQVQSIRALTNTSRETVQLLDAGYGSASQIVGEGDAALARKTANGISPEHRDEIFARAEGVVLMSIALGMTYGIGLTAAQGTHVIQKFSPPSGETLSKYPSLSTLFGDLDYCECRHCRSVLGPAAYLTDLMHFLQRSPLKLNLGGELSPANLEKHVDSILELATGGTVLGVLLRRRPDLADLEMSCENTDTEIPYIDLVLEILENAAGLPLIVDRAKYAGVDIAAEFAAGTVPGIVVDALAETDITVGKSLTFTENQPVTALGTGAAAFLHEWIIKDGSRRWFVRYITPVMRFSVYNPATGQFIPGPSLADENAAMDALDQGRFNAELEDKLSQSLKIVGPPQIQKATTPGIDFLQLWMASYTRGLAIKPNVFAGTVELFDLNDAGRPFKIIALRNKTVQAIHDSFTNGLTAKIDSNVAQLLGIPADEPYLQVWNPGRKWWELSVRNQALFASMGQLAVLGLTFQNSSVRTDLEASPENRNPSAYRKLSENAVFPWTLPFDLWLEETRAFLEALGVSRGGLFDIARPHVRLSDEAATLEQLGLSKSEADIVVSAGASIEPWIYWGLSAQNNRITDHAAGETRTGDWQAVLSSLSMILQQSGLSYREYLDFRQTHFAGQSKGVLMPPNECKPGNLTLIGLDPDEFAEHLYRIHVFTRLWRRSGWRMHDLDMVLAAFGGQVSPTRLEDLALLNRLRTALRLPLPALVGCIDQLGIEAWTDHTQEETPILPSLFDSVFQRPALRTLSSYDDFSLESILVNTTLKISERADFIAASLGVTASQVTTWMHGAVNLGIEDVVTLDSLSRLYTAASLCHALDIRPETLADIVALLGAGQDVFRELPPSLVTREERTRVRARDLFEFVERVDAVWKSSFDFETLSYLLRHKLLAGETTTQIEQRLTQTVTALRAASQLGAVLDDVSEDNLARQLAHRGWYGALIEVFMGSEGLSYQPGATVEFRLPLRADPVIPPDLQMKFSYQRIERTRAVLSCIGSVSESDFRSLASLNVFSQASVADLQTRYTKQLEEHAIALARFLQILDLDTLPRSEQYVAVEELLAIPGLLLGRLQFELLSATTGRLRLTGWLTHLEKTAFDDANPALSAVSTALQTQAEAVIPALTPAVLAEAERLLLEPDLSMRLRAVLLQLASHLEFEVVTAQLSTALGLAQQVVGRVCNTATINGVSLRVLLTDAAFLRSNHLDRPAWLNQFAALDLLDKIATIVSRLDIRPEQWDWLQRRTFEIIDVLVLPTDATPGAASFDGWRRLVDLFRLRDVLPDGPARLARIEAALRTPLFKTTIQKEFAEAFALKAGDVDDVDGACSTFLLEFQRTTPGDYDNPSRLLELAQLLHVIQSLGTTANMISSLIKVTPDRSTAQSARELFAASIDADSLPERLRPISNRLRDLQRDALVAYLVQRDQLADVDELFDHYLIDVQMGACMLTSRIKQAISSVQLFVQRCLLNLERPDAQADIGVRPDSIDSERWQWMKSYRVWEANRKIFLYPENWIEPSLRDDKSEIFRALESDLQQAEISHETALAAFRTYLDGLGEIANLTVISMFEERLADRLIVHVVGRDNSEPYKHFYRQWKLLDSQRFGTWTAWEAITAKVNSDHVLVFLFGGSVYLAWPFISSTQGNSPEWKVGMNLARRTTSGWVSFKKGRGEARFRMDLVRDERRELAFRTRYDGDRAVSIEIYGPRDQPPDEKPQEAVYSHLVYNPAGGRYQNPQLDLKLRALARYTFKNLDGSTQVYHRLETATQLLIQISVKLKGAAGQYPYIFPPFPLAGGLTWRADTTTLFSSLGVSFPDPIDSIEEVTVMVSNSSFRIPMSFVSLNSLLWHEDIIVDRTIPSSLAELVKRGSFILKADESFELDAQPDVVDRLTPPSGSENFESGYRELDSPPDELVLPPDRQALTETPGRYVIVEAQSPSGSSAREIVAYRDDRFSLLFWSGVSNYRVIPFSTAGLADLKSAITQGRLVEAVALQRPGSVKPKQLPVGSGIEVRDPRDSVDGPLVSVTQVDIDFEKVPAAIYNWEIFFHIPLLVATQLSRAQRFEEAQRWFHLIFDPTTNDPGPEPIRYWRFEPFRKEDSSIDKLLEDLAKGYFSLKVEIEEWAENPFRPHLVARQRVRPYKFLVLQKYLENLIAWGDQHFRRDTIESINEATQLYVLAARILGRRPAASPKTAVLAKSYRDLQSRLDYFSNAWTPWEPLLVSGNDTSSNTVQQSVKYRGGVHQNNEQLFSLGSLYFCVPGNEKLAEYWGMVEDRLFKIRHCMNIEGIERRLPLFEPPIDPALLARATAAGIDLATVLSDLEAPLPLYRFNVMLQKALEMCAEVRALGSALLVALEKKDAEELSLLRSRHELQMLRLVRFIKEQQIEEAEANLAALRKTREVVAERYLTYQRLMGKQNSAVPDEDAAMALEPSTLQLTPPTAQGIDTTGLALISAESAHMDFLNNANDLGLRASEMSIVAGFFHDLPNVTTSASGGIGIVSGSVGTTHGGSHLGHAASAIGAVLEALAKNATYHAGLSQTIGGYQRRQDDWRFQSNLAARELEQVDKQIIANEIRKQIAEREMANHDQQIANAEEVDDFMRNKKYTNQELYSWMVGQISSVYFRAYQLAHALSKRAERAYRFELGLTESRFIEYGYWDSLKKGLMAGEMLGHDLKRMEAAYLDQNKREYEITKHVSLLQLDPLALVMLKESGRCELSVPEALFDLDFPGHYLRRIKSVSLTLPCVTGPYSGVPCTMILLKSQIRHSNATSGGYARTDNNASRFTDLFGPIQSIVTSSGQNDSGMFEPNLRDERYLPFEGAGVISTWRLELPRDFRPFDYDTISDVILHIRYTAREGGDLLRQQASQQLQTAINQLIRSESQQGLARIFSLRHEFPNAFYKLLHPAGTTQQAEFELGQEHFPFFLARQNIALSAVSVYLMSKSQDALNTDQLTLTVRLHTAEYEVEHWDSFGSNMKEAMVTLTGNPMNKWTIDAGTDGLDPEELADILILLQYNVSSS